MADLGAVVPASGFPLGGIPVAEDVEVEDSAVASPFPLDHPAVISPNPKSVDVSFAFHPDLLTVQAVEAGSRKDGEAAGLLQARD